MIFESANQTVQVKAFMHGLVNSFMPITYTPGRYASCMFEKAKYKVNKLIIQIKIFHNEENSDEIMTNGD